jgi:cold shock protein
MAQIGICKFFNNDRGFGFLGVEGEDRDTFVHIRALQDAGITGLEEGDRVEFEISQGRDGRNQATALRKLDGRLDSRLARYSE